MSVRLEMQGLSELRQALQNLPEDLTDEASTIVEQHALEAEHQIVEGYPERSGRLRRGVRRDHYRGRFTTHWIVRSRAPHSHLFERGTARRQTAKGANRGSMPAAPEAQRMVPKVIRRRRAMVEALKDLVRRVGFKVD